MKFVLVYFCLYFLLTACNKNEPEVFQENISSTAPFAMSGLDDLEIGDEFRYELFLGENYYDDDNPNFELRPDTLVLEVCGISSEGKYVISERFTEHSSIFTTEEIYYPYNNADSVFTNYWVIENDSLKLEEKAHDGVLSHLFLFSTPSLPLQEFDENETELFGWKIVGAIDEFNSNLFVKNGEIGNFIYEHINVVVDNYATVVDGPGFLYFYNRDDGIIRTTTYSSWTGMGVGWQRIE